MRRWQVAATELRAGRTRGKTVVVGVYDSQNPERFPVFEELRFRRAPPSSALFYFKGGTSPGEVLRWKPVGSGGIVRRVCFFWQVSLVYSTVYCESRRRTSLDTTLRERTNVTPRRC